MHWEFFSLVCSPLRNHVTLLLSHQSFSTCKKWWVPCIRSIGLTYWVATCIQIIHIQSSVFLTVFRLFYGWKLPKPLVAKLSGHSFQPKRKKSLSYPWWVGIPPIRSPEGIQIKQTPCDVPNVSKHCWWKAENNDPCHLFISLQVYEFLDCVTSYTELLRENKLGDIDCSGDKKIWKIVTPRLLYKSGKGPCIDCFVHMMLRLQFAVIWPG